MWATPVHQRHPSALADAGAFLFRRPTAHKQFLQAPDFWMVLHKIIWNNSILSGDKAVVIALAARSLPTAQQKKAVLFG